MINKFQSILTSINLFYGDAILGGGDAAGLVLAARIFFPVWLAIAITNLWVGVSQAGYSVREELPVLLIVFIVPVVVAALAIWRYLHS